MSTLRPPRVPQLVCGCLTAAVLLGGCSGEQNSATSSANSAGQASGGTDNAGSGGSPVYAAGAGSTAGGASGGSEPSSAGGSPASAGSAGAVLAGQSGSGAGGTSGAPNTAGAAGVAASDSVPLDPALLSKCTGTNPIVCAFDAPNGDYDVTAEVGDPAQAAASRLSAETLHYQGAAVDTAAGVFQKLTFTVNVRMEKHDGGQSAPGNILDIMISGMAPKLHGLGFRAAKNAITLFYAGDSTACDWVDSNTSNLGPGETGSAQALSMYLKPGVAVANYADSGETAGSFYSKFFDPYATSLFKEGDFVFVQFGTNDSKDAATTANGGKVYKDNLMKYVTAARAKNAIPVILTPVSRKGGTAANPGFQGLDQAARDFAAAQNVALIDMTALSRAYYATVTDKNALFVDSGTHFSELGATGVAATLAKAIQSSTLALKAFVK